MPVTANLQGSSCFLMQLQVSKPSVGLQHVHMHERQLMCIAEALELIIVLKPHLIIDYGSRLAR